MNFGVVDEGAVEVSVYATGKVVPFAEEVITSPVSSKVLEVYKKSGDRVRKDEPLLQLDLETIRTEYETKKESLEMQLNKLDLQRKTIASDLAEMKMQVDIDEMMLKRTLVSLNNERYLDSIGASTREKVREAELNYTVKQMQLEQLKRKYENKKSTSQSEIRSLELDYKIAKRNMDLLFKTLGEAQVMAPRSATLTWINDQVGASISQGSNLAILSDLSSFKVEGEIADSYADKITAGNRVNVVIGGEKLSGTVGNVTPSVNNGVIKFVVFLDDQSNTRLRSGLKVDIHVTHAMKDETLRLPTGAYYMGRGDYDLWVVNGERVEKRKVMLGESGFEYVEVLQGLTGGDSAAYVKMYVDRWVRKQLKLQEAEILFSESAGDIDRMVEEYRQALLIRKLDQHYVDRSVDTVFTDDEIAAYYNAHKADFRLDRPIVKGRIVRLGLHYRQAAKLKSLMASGSAAQQQDFSDLCAKNDFAVNDFREQWIDFPEFLSYLPTLRSQNYDAMLATTAVQEMRDSHSQYYFQIDEVRREGEPIPLERLRPTIRRILFNRRQGEVIRRHEEELFDRASENGEVSVYGLEETDNEETK